ncbi:O-methyltransferase [Desulfurobacterium sp.]
MGIGNKKNHETSYLKERWQNRSEIVPPDIEDFTSQFNEREFLLKEIETFASENKVPILLPSAARFLQIICRTKQPEEILEIGTGIGYSTLSMLFALNGRSRITSVDFNGERVQIAKEFIQRSGFFVNLIYDDAFNVISNFIAEGKQFDFIFVDSMKSEYIFMNFKIQTLLKNNGIAVFDNVLFRGYVCGRYPEKYRRSVKLLKTFLKHVKEYPGFTASIIPVGDGLLILERKG